MLNKISYNFVDAKVSWTAINRDKHQETKPKMKDESFFIDWPNGKSETIGASTPPKTGIRFTWSYETLTLAKI